MVCAFAATTGALPTRARGASSARRSTVRCSVPEVEEYFPAYRRNKAPMITFDAEVGVQLQMGRVKAFRELEEEDSGPLLEALYAEPDSFTKKHPVPPSEQSWPSGDGRGVEMNGTKGFFTQPNLKQYGPFPDFFKRSCDS